MGSTFVFDPVSYAAFFFWRDERTPRDVCGEVACVAGVWRGRERENMYRMASEVIPSGWLKSIVSAQKNANFDKCELSSDG